MNHEYYRSRFNQYPPLPDDRVVYGPHPKHKNWYEPQWNASQMLPDQNAQHRPYPRWTSANMIGDLGPYGRYQEAKNLAGADFRRKLRKQYPIHLCITTNTLNELRADAVRETNKPLFGNTTEGAFLTSVLLGGFIGGAIYVARGGSFDQAAGIFDVTALSMIGGKAAQVVQRARRMRRLSEDEVIAG